MPAVISGGDGRTAPSLLALVDKIGVPSQILYLGNATGPSLPEGEHESRRCPPVEGIPVEQGVYAFRNAGVWRALVVDHEAGQRDHEFFQSEQTTGTNLWAAAIVSQVGWQQGQPVSTVEPLFNIGDAVSLIGTDDLIGTVSSTPISTRQGWTYRVQIGRTSRSVPETGLRRIDDVSSPATWSEFPPTSVRELMKLLTVVKTERPMTDIVYSLGATRTVFRPYQFKPLLKLLQTNNSRLLIADEVGLGKTIEAGLIWTELHQRVGLRRALVVCPASLTRKWQSEMRRRFGVELEIVNRQRLELLTEQLEEGHDVDFLGAVSLESLRSADVLERLNRTQPRFDLIIVDEAHYLRNRDTRSYELGELLSEWADVLLFLSATPLNLGTDDLFNLLNLLADDQFPDTWTFEQQLAPNSVLLSAAASLSASSDSFDTARSQLTALADLPLGAPLLNSPRIADLLTRLNQHDDLSPLELARARRALIDANTLSTTVSRTRKVDVPDAKATRVSEVIDVHWSDPELRFYNAVLGWARDRALSNNGVVGFATVMPLRQAASCIPAMRQLLADNYLVRALDDDFDEDIDLDETFGEPSTPDEANSLRELQLALREVDDRDTKFEVFLARLRKIQESGLRQVMVFSFFRRTLAYLHDRLMNEFRVRVMDGSVPPAQRAILMEDFRRGDFDILLLSEVGSEGLDFEFVGALVNYDLPWNPMRVEQRIGRLDRFGQAHERIHIYNFHVPGTIETDIFERLYERIQVFKESIGELEPILRNEVNDITRLVLDPKRSDEERQREMDRIAIAIENKRADLDQLQERASGLLTGLDQILIDGFEDQVLGAGKFIGAPEVDILVSDFVTSHHGAIKPLRDGKVHEIVGSTELEHRLTVIGSQTGDRRIESLSRQLREGESLFVVFDAQASVGVSAELVVVGHPLMKAAVRDAAEALQPAWRRGSVRIPGLPVPRATALLSIVEITGADPARELVGVAVDDQHLDQQPIIDMLLRHVALGTLTGGREVAISADTVTVLEGRMHDRRHEIEEERRRTNEAQITARQETLKNTFGHKIRKAASTLETVRATSRSTSIERLYQGRITNLKARLEVELQKLASKRDLTVSWEPIAIIDIERAD